MNTVLPVEILDGNQYKVEEYHPPAVSGTFDKVYSEAVQSVTSLEDIFVEAASEYDVPVDLLKAVAQAESGFDTNAVSSCGASGIMQLMPQTAQGLGVEDVFNARQNVTGGAKMLSYLLDDYNGDTSLALAAYNAGSGAVEKYGGVPPYAETQNYIHKVQGILEGQVETDLSGYMVSETSEPVVATLIPEPVEIAPQPVTAAVRTKADGSSTTNRVFSGEDYQTFVDIYERTKHSPLLDSMTTKESDIQTLSGEQQKLFEMESFQSNYRFSTLFNAKQ